DFGTGPLPVFVRVQEVRPDPVANRTLVRLQKPPVAKPAPSSATPEAIASDTKHLLRTIIARYREGAMELRGAPRITRMQRAVNDHLDALEQHLDEDVPFPAMIAHLNRETLPGLETELRTAEERGRNAQLRPRLASLITELNDVSASASS